MSYHRQAQSVDAAPHRQRVRCAPRRSARQSAPRAAALFSGSDEASGRPATTGITAIRPQIISAPDLGDCAERQRRGLPPETNTACVGAQGDAAVRIDGDVIERQTDRLIALIAERPDE